MPTGLALPAEPASSGAHPHDNRIERLRELVTLLERSSLSELAYEDEDIAVTLRRHSAVGPAHAPPPPPPPPPAPHTPPRPELGLSTASRPAAREEPDVFVVKSPFVGTFYRAASPNTPPFTDVNQHVRRGQIVCIIEAMKLMNEIESEVDGTVIEVLVDNGQSVQYGDAIFRIRSKG